MGDPDVFRGLVIRAVIQLKWAYSWSCVCRITGAYSFSQAYPKGPGDLALAVLA